MSESAGKESRPAPGREAGGGKRLKVLAAEDNPVVRKGLANFLSQWGYQPVEAATGDDAWRLLEEDREIRLAVLDWNLPGLNGLQICQRLRVRPAGPYVYAIIFSARNSVEEQVQALEGGADDYLPKPAKPSLLRARITAGRRIIETALGKAAVPPS
ncbi:MAG: response regulator [Desulfobacteraceae bacterium]|nr:response regulator [Desulfobacteraceae bacterium]